VRMHILRSPCRHRLRPACQQLIGTSNQESPDRCAVLFAEGSGKGTHAASLAHPLQHDLVKTLLAVQERGSRQVGEHGTTGLAVVAVASSAELVITFLAPDHLLRG